MSTSRMMVGLSLALVLLFPVGSAAQLAPDEVPEGLAASEWSSIRAAYDAGRHAAHPVDDGHRARNPGQQWSTHFDDRGFLTTPDAGGWSWGLALQNYGFAGQVHSVASKPAHATSAAGQRVAYDWDETLTEWYVNDRRGLEHGFTVHRRPDTSARPNAAGGATGLVDELGPLTFTLAVRGGLTPDVTSDGRGARFVDNEGATALTYSGLVVFDADGRDLAARLESTHDGLRLSVDERGARYPLTIDPVAQQAYLKASNTEAFDGFGFSVAVSGDTVVVGARNEDSAATGVDGDQSDNGALNSGAAYVFVRNAGVWTQQAYLKASNTDDSDGFGTSVAIAGDTVVVGAENEDSAATGVDGDTSDNSASDAGAAYVFVRNAGVWTQQAYLKASNTESDDRFGFSAALWGDTVVVGALEESSAAMGVDGDGSDNSAERAGAAYVFVRNAGVWSQQAYLKASNTDALDFFGTSVALAGDTVVVGARFEDSAATGVDGDGSDNGTFNAGAAYVFVRNAGVWSQQAYLKASNTGVVDSFGWSVAIYGDTLVVGAGEESSAATGVDGDQSDNTALFAGAAYVFVRNAGVWTQQAYLKASNTEGGNIFGGEFFGGSVAVSGDTIVVGAYGEESAATGIDGDQSDNSAERAGAAYVFVRNAGVWSQQAYLKASNTDEPDEFGRAVALSGDTLVVGAAFEDSASTGVDSDGSDNSATFAGAAYVFDLDLGPEPECFLVIGAPQPGDAAFAPYSHEFATQVGAVEQWFPVLLDDIPEFVIWEAPPSMRASLAGVDPTGSAHGNQLGGSLGANVLDDLDISTFADPLPKQFTAQVLMWNPQVFPSNPEQFTHGLVVRVQPSGRVVTVPYGTSDGGMELWAETYWDDRGRKVLRLPFSIPGF